MTVQPRETPAERADAPVEIVVDEALTVLAAQLDEWVATMEHWELAYCEGHEFGKTNNVEARLLLTAPGHTCSLVFRLDQLEAIEEFDRELWLTLDERDGIARAVHLAPLGMDVELFHIVGPPLGGTAA
jgi:hypothetical protein